MRLVLNRLLVSSCVAIVAAAAVGCGSEKALEPGTVSGTWTGTVVVNSRPSTLTLELSQDGSTVFGTAYSGTVAPDEPDDVSGSASEGELRVTITRPADPTADDCHLFPFFLTFEVQEDALIITDGSGTSCQGDGAGGHRSLTDITGATGTLHRK